MPDGNTWMQVEKNTRGSLTFTPRRVLFFWVVAINAHTKPSGTFAFGMLEIPAGAVQLGTGLGETLCLFGDRRTHLGMCAASQWTQYFKFSSNSAFKLIPDDHRF